MQLCDDPKIPTYHPLKEIPHVDVALICSPSRKVKEIATGILELVINTVDSFDFHSEIINLRNSLDTVAKANGKVSIISAGWDPGINSVSALGSLLWLLRNHLH
jgi:diaminopimelate dehydrogenase